MKSCQYKPADGGFECVVCCHRWRGTGRALIRDCPALIDKNVSSVPVVVRAVNNVPLTSIKGPGDFLHGAILH